MEKFLKLCFTHFVTNSPIDAYTLVKIQERKGIIPYYKTNGVEKTCGCRPCCDCKTLEKEINSPMKQILKLQQIKRNLICLAMQYYYFLIQKILSKKMICNKRTLL